MQEIVKSKAMCHKCGSRDLILVEIWEGHTIEWQQINGEFDKNDGTLEAGDPYKVEGQCKKCGHAWVFRKKIQITDLIITQ